MIDFVLNSESKFQVGLIYFLCIAILIAVPCIGVYSNLSSQKEPDSGSTPDGSRSFNGMPISTNYLTSTAVIAVYLGAFVTTLVCKYQLSGAEFNQYGPIVITSLFAPGFLLIWMSKCENFQSFVADPKGNALDTPIAPVFEYLTGLWNSGNVTIVDDVSAVGNKYGYYIGQGLLLASLLAALGVITSEF